MADNNVFILFEEIKTALKGINSKLEELPKVITKQPQSNNDKPDLSPVKEAVAETAKAQSEEVKCLLERQWKAYAQLSSLTLQQLDDIRKSQDGQVTRQEPQPQEHIHKHSFDIKSSKVFSFVVGLGAVCALSLWGNIKQWQSKRQYADDALKFRAIRAWVDVMQRCALAEQGVRHPTGRKGHRVVRKQADGYDTALKAVSDSLMQERLQNSIKPQ